jgi:hypothetical protein
MEQVLRPILQLQLRESLWREAARALVDPLALALKLLILLIVASTCWILSILLIEASIGLTQACCQHHQVLDLQLLPPPQLALHLLLPLALVQGTVEHTAKHL